MMAPTYALEDLFYVLSILRLALPATLLLTLALRWGSHAFLSLMDNIQSQGYKPLEDPPERQGAASNAAGAEAGDGEDGIHPVVVKVAAVRRGLVLGLFAFVAGSYFADGVAQVVATLIQNHYTPSDPLYTNIIEYTVGGLTSYALCAIAMTYEERVSKKEAGWSTLYPKIFTFLGWAIEIPIIAITARIIQLDPSAQPSQTPLPTIHLSILAFRILLITFLLLSQFPILFKSSFIPYTTLHPKPSEESTSLLGGPSLANYGATNGTANGDAALKKPNMLRSSQPPSNRPPDAKDLTLMTLFTRVKLLFPYLWPSKSFGLQVLALICFGLMLVKRFVNVATPIFFGRIINDLATQKPPYVNIAIYVLVSFLQSSNTMLYQYLWLPIEQYTEREMTMMAFDSLLNLSLSYHTKRKTGELLRILDRSEAINDFFETLIFTFIPILIDLPVAAGVIWVRYGITIFGIVFVVSTVFVTTSMVLAESRTQLRRKLRDASQFMRQIQTDTLFNWETAKIFTSEAFESARLRDAMFVYQKGYFKLYSAWNSLSLIQESISGFGLLVCSFILAKRVVDGNMTVGNYVTFVSYLSQLYGPLNRIASLYRQIMSNLVDTEQLMDLLKEEKDIVDRPGATELVLRDGSIEFNDVKFSYDGKQDTIKGISFSVKAGQSVALVGPSGGGKSTIMRLLYRFYDVTDGSITIEGKDIRDITQHSLRKNIGLVPQDSVLFNETARYNIAYGGVGREITEEDVAEAAKAASLYDRIMGFPDKFETRVGERGQRLSGGEKQRVAIARVLLKNPPILLLDEATSALDTTNERAIQAKLRDLSKGRTTLSIAHRLSTVVDCDVIYVLNEGKIAESGSHADLLAQGGIYSELWAKQIEANDSVPGTGPSTPAPGSRAGTPKPGKGKK
ncbi:vacuolar ABC heavy metal transporter Hmt1 [Pseudohyphozyma bogoriensis]|nr:vacuolar ABC heavy metal transporter Hmt1 [Pseudohyphozyma bogoriensis]